MNFVGHGKNRTKGITYKHTTLSKYLSMICITLTPTDADVFPMNRVRMSFFTRLFSTSTSQTVAFSNDLCLSCESACTKHAQLPDYLQSKIDQGDMTDSFKPYKRHVLAKLGTGDSWAPSLDEVDGSFYKVLSDSMKGGKGRVMMTAYHDVQPDGAPAVTCEETTVMVFPDAVKLPLRREQIQTFADWIQSDTPSPPTSLEATPIKQKVHGILT
jgi:hypothetical protein